MVLQRVVKEVLLILLSAIIIAGCGDFKAGTSGTPDVEREISYCSLPPDGERLEKIIAYFVTTKGIYLYPQTIEIPGGTREPVKTALEHLIKGPQRDWGKSVIPEGTKLISLEISDNCAKVNFSKEFLERPYNLMVLDKLKLQAVHHTLREFEDISKVTILVEGQPYEGDSGFSPWLNSISEENTNPTPSDDERYFKILIYLADEGGHLLIPVTRRVDIKGGFDNGRVPLKDLALEAINQLINGPEESEKLAPTVPKGVELRDFYIKDNTAYVDIGKEIIIKNINKEINEKLAIESIVYTLTSLSGIDQVQFLIDGKVMGSISGSVNISKPIKPSKWINLVSPDGL